MVTQTATARLRESTTGQDATDELWEQEAQALSDVVADGWLTRIRTHVYNHPEVEELFVSIDAEPVVDYWIVIPRRDIGLVERLVEDQQKKILRLFAGTANPPFQLDFHIYYREGRVAKDLIPSNGIRIPRF